MKNRTNNKRNRAELIKHTCETCNQYIDEKMEKLFKIFAKFSKNSLFYVTDKTD